MLRTSLLFVGVVLVLQCGISDEKRDQAQGVLATKGSYPSVPTPSVELMQLEQQNDQDTLPATIVDMVFASEYYRNLNQPYIKTGGLSLFVLPEQEDTLVHFQIVNNRYDRMQAISNLGYSSKSRLLYEYDVFQDTLRALNDVELK